MTLLKNIWFILTLDCQGSAELTSESFDRRLHWAERIAVRLHCLICSKSRKLNKQLRAVDNKLVQIWSQNPQAAPLTLSAEAKARISQKLADRK